MIATVKRIGEAETDTLRRRLGPPEDPHPLLTTLDEKLGRGVKIDDPELGQLLGLIVEDYIPRRLNTMLRYHLHNPGMEVAGVSRSSYVVYISGLCSINLSLLDSTSRNLHWHPYDALFLRVNSGTSHVHRYRLPDGLSNEAVDLTAKLEFVETAGFHAGSPLIKRAEIDVLDFEASSESPVVIARLHLPSRGPLDWTFDRQSLTPIGAIGNEPSESQLISLIRTAALFADSDLGLLQCALRHTSHSVRWAAIQAIGMLDRDVAEKLLPGLARDPHPHIRRAAERTLASLAG